MNHGMLKFDTWLIHELYGSSMDDPWVIHGLSMGNRFCLWIIHGRYMDCPLSSGNPWFIQRLDSQSYHIWTIQKLSTWNLWGCSGSAQRQSACTALLFCEWIIHGLPMDYYSWTDYPWMNLLKNPFALTQRRIENIGFRPQGQGSCQHSFLGVFRTHFQLCN